MPNNTKDRAKNLHDMLFMQVERLSDEDMSIDEVHKEMERSKAMCDLATQIMDLARLQLETAKLVNDEKILSEDKPRFLC